jgi:hypothetical protein
MELGLDVNDGTSGHGYFVDILDQALGLLRERKPTADVTRNQPHPAFEGIISNRFALLEVEDFDDAEDVVSHFEKSSKTMKSNTNTTPQIVEPDFSKDDDVFYEMKLRVLCFFDDLHVIQENLQEIWRGYKSGETDLVTVTMTTNAVLSLVEQAEKELTDSWPVSQRCKRFKPKPENWYQCLALFFGPKNMDNQNSHTGDELDELVTPLSSLNALADYIYADSFWTILKFSRGIKDNYNAKNIKVPNIPRIVRFPIYCREAREVFNTKKFRTRDKEDEALTQLLLDTFHNEFLLRKEIIPKMPRLAVFDEFTNAMLKIWELKLSTHTVFAATVMKDIHRILDMGVTRPYDEAKALAEDCERLIWHTTPSAPKGFGPIWQDSDMEFIKHIHSVALYLDMCPIASQKNGIYLTGVSFRLRNAT